MGENALTGWLTDWLGYLGWWIAIGVVIAAGLRTLYANPTTLKLKVALQLITYYARYWMLWLLLWAMWHLSLDGQVFYWWAALFALLYLYMTWVEPNRLRIQHKHITLTDSRQSALPLSTPLSAGHTEPLKLAVIGDIHVGIFSSKRQLQCLVSRLNQLDVDAIVCVGDWLYHPGADLIGQMLIFKALNKPCYSVLSQADAEQLQAIDQAHDQGNYLLANERLTQVLTTLNIQVITDQAIELGGIRVVGLGEGSKFTVSMQGDGQPTLIVTHDIKQIEAQAHVLDRVGAHTLAIAGQTHGGQVNLPLLTSALVKAMTGSMPVAGLFSHPKYRATANNDVVYYQSWTTTGIGMTGLPFRLGCPPTIDVLTIQVTRPTSTP